MNGATTRARTGRTAADARRGRQPQGAPQRGGRGDSSYGAYVDGATALQIGYADPPDVVEPAAPVPRRASRPRQMPASAPVAPPLPVSLPRAPFIILVVAMVIAGVLGVLVLNTKINENAFRLDDLQAQRAALDLQEQQFAQALAERESPGDLAAAARRLGLVPAGTPAFIRLPDGRVVGVPKPASARPTGTASTADPGR